MKRLQTMAGVRWTASRRPAKKRTRTLGCELLERRELLSIGLAGVQSVGLWQMALDISPTTNQGEILDQTSASITLSGSSQQKGQAVSVNWGDGSAVYRGKLDPVAGTASTTHTFSQGVFAVTVTCGADVTRYQFRSSPTALGQVAGQSHQTTDALFIVGNNASNQISVSGIGNGNLQVLVTNPSYQRVVSSQSVAAIYGSTLNGNDTAILAANVMQPAFFALGNGCDRFVGGGGPDTVHGGAGNEVIFGGQGNNAIIGGAGNDWLYGGGGDNVIYGGSGNDHIYAGSGNDMLFGGTGNDYIYGGKGTDLLEGGTGNDTLVAGSGTSYLYGGSGNDLLLGGSGTDWLFGGAGHDRIQCGSGNDVAVGGSGTPKFLAAAAAISSSAGAVFSWALFVPTS